MERETSRSKSTLTTRRREERRPYRRQRDPARWGKAAVYGWSEDKARQYAEPLRADFVAFVRAKGFRLD